MEKKAEYWRDEFIPIWWRRTEFIQIWWRSYAWIKWDCDLEHGFMIYKKRGYRIWMWGFKTVSKNVGLW